MLKIDVQPGQEVIETINETLSRHGLNYGVIVSVIGAVDECCISNMPKHEPRQDCLTEYNVPMELSGCGEIVNGKAHIHCILSCEGDVAIAGHLHWAKVKTWYVHVFVMDLKPDSMLSTL